MSKRSNPHGGKPYSFSEYEQLSNEEGKQQSTRKASSEVHEQLAEIAILSWKARKDWSRGEFGLQRHQVTRFHALLQFYEIPDLMEKRENRRKIRDWLSELNEERQNQLRQLLGFVGKDCAEENESAHSSSAQETPKAPRIDMNLTNSQMQAEQSIVMNKHAHDPQASLLDMSPVGTALPTNPNIDNQWVEATSL